MIENPWITSVIFLNVATHLKKKCAEEIVEMNPTEKSLVLHKPCFFPFKASKRRRHTLKNDNRLNYVWFKDRDSFQWN